MLNLTFGEQVKIILSRKGMTIKELAETIEGRTGKKMSRQNLTQRLGRDNFQEQDMRMIADILGCPFRLSILAEQQMEEQAIASAQEGLTDKEIYGLARAKEKREVKKELPETRELEITVEPEGMFDTERDITIGELVDIHEELDALMELDRMKIVSADSQEQELVLEPEALEEAAVLEEEVQETAVQEAEVWEEAPGAEEVQEEIPVLKDGAEVDMDKKEGQEEPKKKLKGWRAYFQRMTRKEEPEMPAVKESVQIKEAESSEEFAKSLPEPGTAEQETQDTGTMDKETKEPLEVSPDEALQMEEQEAKDSDTEEEPDIKEALADTEEQEDIGFEGEEEDLTVGERNPYSGHEYESNSVRVHPKRIGYVQVYDRGQHRWTDMTEWAFLGYQERKKALLGDDYEAPIYLD